MKHRIKTVILNGVLLLCCTSFSLPASSHHSMIRFDTGKTISVQGVVKRLEWKNPHVYIYMQQVSDIGELVDWEIEGPPPALMLRMGWSQDILTPGQSISVTGSPHRDNKVKSIFPSEINSADDTLFNMITAIFQANSYEEPKSGAKSLAGNWITLFDFQQMTKFAYATNLDLTEAGRLSVKNYDEATMLPARNCIASPIPTSAIFPDTKQIEINDKQVIIRGEYEDTVRVVHLDATDENVMPSIQGHSVGKWEDRTLVIDTSQFLEHRAGNGLGLPSSSEKTTREWLILSEDGKRIDYRLEVTDPMYLNSPAIAELTLVYQPNRAFTPEICDLENALKFAK